MHVQDRPRLSLYVVLASPGIPLPFNLFWLVTKSMHRKDRWAFTCLLIQSTKAQVTTSSFSKWVLHIIFGESQIMYNLVMCKDKHINSYNIYCVHLENTFSCGSYVSLIL
jgi:hypothetical protein